MQDFRNQATDIKCLKTGGEVEEALCKGCSSMIVSAFEKPLLAGQII
jgi:hypothetical protein